MRFAAALLVTFVCSGGVALGEPPADCSKWVLAGYRLGMPKSDVVSREGWKKRRGAEYLVLVDDHWKARISFSKEGVVEAVRAYAPVPVDPAQVKSDLVRRLGPPTADALQALPIGTPWGSITINGARWESVACGADVVLSIHSIGGLFASSETSILLLTHGLKVETGSGKPIPTP